MAKLTVKNVGPIREAELDVKKHTVFIGPQGTGKSTLAKLIAIGSDSGIVTFNNNSNNQNYFEKKYNLNGYISKNSYMKFIGRQYYLEYNDNFKFSLLNKQQNEEKIDISIDKIESISEILSNLEDKLEDNIANELLHDLLIQTSTLRNTVQYKLSGEYSSLYIPAERQLVSILSDAIWSIINSKINLPEIVTSFLNLYENARHQIVSLKIPYLGIKYEYVDSSDFIFQNNAKINLRNTASGYQSIIPLTLVVENQRLNLKNRFVIEEPELNLYPTAQKDLIYSLLGGLQPDVSYQDAEWVFTTHSPYVLSSFNTLMLAYKVGNQSDELRAEVEKIIPSRCWINPDDFAAYYVDNGTVRSIVSEQTGMIAENELDDVSDDLADEQDKLFALRRSSSRA
ncbi:putative ATPase [Spirosoma oryzae]|uniref:Putative ATPase n=1 Tax=Spirosoma oryzae TaxID=1469603 RepID=A0A2T0SU97_9BACT|nr:AAA family ATPase [Spirosoma oryzae]PRY36997.1 putative ATPase [Spirosoma oryzae]